MFGRCAIPAALAVLMALPATAQVPDDVVRVSIVPGWRDADGRHVAGLWVRLAPGWKTYWRAPGDSGIPPVFDWSGSANIADMRVHYPVPSVFRQNGIRAIGYKDAVLFPLLIETRDADGPVRLRGEVELGVCEEICIPVSFRFDTDLTTGDGDWPELRAALADRPRAGGALRCDIAPISDGLRVGIETDLAPGDGEEVAVVEAGEAGLWISEADVTRQGATLRAEVEMVPPDARPFAISRSEVRLTVLSGGQAVESEGCE